MRIYLANPDGFTNNMHQLGSIIARLEAQGHTVCNPWTAHDWTDSVNKALNSSNVYTRNDACRTLATRIGHENYMDILHADTVLAVLNGMEPDSGTVAEVAYAAGLGRTVYGIRTDMRDCGDLPGVPVNLQLLFFIENSGGCLFRDIEDIKL